MVQFATQDSTVTAFDLSDKNNTKMIQFNASTPNMTEDEIRTRINAAIPMADMN